MIQFKHFHSLVLFFLIISFVLVFTSCKKNKAPDTIDIEDNTELSVDKSTISPSQTPAESIQENKPAASPTPDLGDQDLHLYSPRSFYDVNILYGTRN